MQVRRPGIQLDDADLIWSRVPEFAIAYNGFSVIIPHVEYYLNHIMGQVRDGCGDGSAGLRRDLDIFIRQEALHSRYHNRFNQRMYAAGYDSLKPLVERMAADLKRLRETRSLAFNAAYCAGFECIATYDAQYLFNHCDAYFAGADSHGANLLLWHVAEEFEHRCVCHDAFKVISGNYFIRIYGLLYAFWHIGGAFLAAEQLILQHRYQAMAADAIAASAARSKKLFWRQLAYVAPRMLKIFIPFYNPARIPVPPRITRALAFFQQQEPIHERVELAPERPDK